MNELEYRLRCAAIVLHLAKDQEPKHKQPFQDKQGRWRNPNGTYMTVDDIAKMKESPAFKAKKVKDQMQEGSGAITAGVSGVGQTFDGFINALGSTFLAQNIEDKIDDKVAEETGDATPPESVEEEKKSIAQRISDTASTLGDYITQTAMPAIESHFQSLGNTFRQKATDIWQAVANSEAGKAIGNLANDIGNAVVGVAKKVYAEISKLASQANQIIQSGWDKVQTHLGRSNKKIDKVLNDPEATVKQKEDARRARGALRQVARQATENLNDATFDEAIDRLLDETDLTMQQVENFLQGFFPEQADKISDRLEALQEKAKADADKQKPTISDKEEPSTPPEPQPTISDKEEPSTPPEPQPTISDKEEPSTPPEPQPTISDKEEPSTPPEPQPTISDKEEPSTPPEPQPTISDKEEPSTPPEPQWKVYAQGRQEPKHKQPFQDKQGRWRNPNGTYMTVDDIAKMKESPAFKAKKVKDQMQEGSGAITAGVSGVGQTFDGFINALGSTFLAQNIEDKIDDKVAEETGDATPPESVEEEKKSIAQRISDTASTLSDYITQTAMPAIESHFQSLGNTFRQKATDIWQAVANSEAGKAIGNLANDIGNAVVGVAKKVYAEISKLASQANQIIQSGWDKVQTHLGRSNKKIDKVLNDPEATVKQKEDARRARGALRQVARQATENLNDATFDEAIDRLLDETDLTMQQVENFLQGFFPEQADEISDRLEALQEKAKADADKQKPTISDKEEPSTPPEPQWKVYAQGRRS